MDDVEYFFVKADPAGFCSITFPNNASTFVNTNALNKFLPEKIKEGKEYKFPLPKAKEEIWVRKDNDGEILISNYPFNVILEFYPDQFCLSLKKELIKDASFNNTKITSEKGQCFSLADFIKILNI